MRQTFVLAALAALVLVGPTWGQQRDKKDKRGLKSDPLQMLARKAALRLAGFEAQEGEETDSADSTQVSKPKLRVYIDDHTGMMMIDGPPEEIARFEHAYDLVIEKMRKSGRPSRTFVSTSAGTFSTARRKPASASRPNNVVASKPISAVGGSSSVADSPSRSPNRSRKRAEWAAAWVCWRRSSAAGMPRPPTPPS